MINPLDLIKELAEKEQRDRDREIVAPYSFPGMLKVRLAGIIRNFPVILKGKKTPREGFGVFRVVLDTVVYHRAADQREIDAYLKLLPRARFVLMEEADGHWLAWQTGVGTRKLQTNGPVVIRRVQRSQQFDSIVAAFDGENFWFVERNKSTPAAHGVTLREELMKLTDPEKIKISGLHPAALDAYLVSWLKARPKGVYDPDTTLTEMERIQLALEMAGAKLQSVRTVNGTTASVSFDRRGSSHTVTIDRKTLQVISSGICLSGKDRDFDITSLVSVFNEADQKEEERDPWDD